jgi:hypothetical protein
MGRVISFFVWKAYWRRVFIWSIISMKAGSRWPRVGFAMAASTRGLMSDGPGPMRVRTGGAKDGMAIGVLSIKQGRAVRGLWVVSRWFSIRQRRA